MQSATIKRWKNSFIFRQIFFSYFITIVILSILVTFFITTIYNTAIKNTVYRINQKLLAQSNYSVQYIDELAQRLTDSLNQDQTVIGFLYADHYDPKKMIYLNQAVQKKIFSLDYVNSVYLYNVNQDIIYSSQTGEQTISKNFSNQTMVGLLNMPQRLRELKGEPIANNTHSNGGSPNVYSYVLPVWERENNTLKSALIININVESLINTINAINKTEDDLNTHFFVVNKKGQILGTPLSNPTGVSNTIVEQRSPNEALLAPEIVERMGAEGSPYFTYDIDGKRYLVMYNELTHNDWTLVGLFSEDDLFQDVNKISYLSVGILFILFFACLLFGLANAKRISQPIQKISLKIRDALHSIHTKNTDTMTEIELIQSLFGNMEEQNQRFEGLRQESNYAIKQELLRGLVSGNNVHTKEKILERLDFLDLSFVHQSALRIFVLQIDDYLSFKNLYNPRERWAYQYSITNLVAEVTKEEIQSVVFSQDHDKFVVLVANSSLTEDNSGATLEKLLRRIQTNLQEHLDLSLSVAYSDCVKDFTHIAREYETVMDLLQLRIKYGYGSLLSPHLLADVEYESLEVPPQKEAALFNAINKSHNREAIQVLETLLDTVRPYSYDEIIYYMNHLAYAINEEVITKNIDSRIQIQEMFQSFLTALSEAETLSHIQVLFIDYIDQLCLIVDQKQDTKNNMQIITNRVLTIIETEYIDQNISLNAIASRLNLSPKYVGRIFRETAGTSVSRYLLEYRLDLVGKAIENQQYDGAETLEKVGLEFNNYFYTCFKNYFGMTLNEYRSKYAKKDSV